MGIVLKDMNADYPDTFPKFGNVVSDTSAVFVMRASNKLNCFNLSDGQATFTPVNNPTLSSKNGIQRTPSQQGYLTTDYPGNEDEITVLLCAKIEVLVPSTTESGICYALGNFQLAGSFNAEVKPTDVSPKGHGVYLMKSNGVVLVRSVVNVFRPSTGAFVGWYTTLSVPEETATKWQMYAVTLSRSSKVNVVSCLSSPLEVRSTTPPVTDIATGAEFDKFTNAPLKILSGYTDTAVKDNVYIKEMLYHNKVLSDAEIARQYLLTKASLKAEGIDVAHWV